MADPEVTRMDHDAFRGFYGKPDTFGRGMAYPDKFNFKGFYGKGLAGIDEIQIDKGIEFEFNELVPHNPQGKCGSINRKPDFL